MEEESHKIKGHVRQEMVQNNGPLLIIKDFRIRQGLINGYGMYQREEKGMWICYAGTIVPLLTETREEAHDIVNALDEFMVVNDRIIKAV